MAINYVSLLPFSFGFVPYFKMYLLSEKKDNMRDSLFSLLEQYLDLVEATLDILLFMQIIFGSF